MPFSPLLPIHITARVVGILSGAAAMPFRKGSPRHALAGTVFVIAMMTMASSAVYPAFHETPGEQRSSRHFRVLSGDNG
jgi:uncharacterized membrane protein